MILSKSNSGGVWGGAASPRNTSTRLSAAAPRSNEWRRLRGAAAPRAPRVSQSPGTALWYNIWLCSAAIGGVRKSVLMRAVNRVLHKFGFDLAPYRPHEYAFPPDFDQATIDVVRDVSPFTRTSPERIFALCEAIRYI